MKKIFLKIGSIFIFSFTMLNGKAQNSLDLRWGLNTPVNNNMNYAFINSEAFSIGLLHPISNSSFSAGVTFSHQNYQSKEDFFKPGYASQLSIHNYLLTTRYDFLRQSDFKLYTAMDAGLNKIKNRATRNGISNEDKNAGLTVGIALGADLKISGRLLLGANIQSQYQYINNIQFDDKVNVNHLTCIAGNISLRFLLGTKK
jgi:hypothetical protein